MKSNFRNGTVMREELRSAKSERLLADLRSDLQASNLQMLGSAGVFAGRFKPNDWVSFVEFDICHALPVTAQPAYGTGNVTAFHPATLAMSHEDLLYQQCNLEHLVKAHDPKNITHDRIIGCVVATSFPPEPEGGWTIPDSKAEAACIHCCAAVFKVAQGAVEMLNEHVSEERKWSVSIEVMGRAMDQMGLYRPSTKELFPLLDAPDAWFDALARNDQKRLCVGKLTCGEQLALVYGGTGNKVMFQGVGFTGTPASLEAQITAVQLSAMRPEGRSEKAEGRRGDIITTPEGVCAVQMSAVDTALARSVIGKRFPGAELVDMTSAGPAWAPGRRFYMEATPTDPVAQIRLPRGAVILKRMSELAAA
jgi:hypothetical protein